MILTDKYNLKKNNLDKQYLALILLNKKIFKH